jgi:molybdate-binding protein
MAPAPSLVELTASTRRDSPCGDNGHFAAAYCVASREADACLATCSAAQAFGLDFIPLHSERYDLVMYKRTADLSAVKAFLDVLQRAILRRKLEVLARYCTLQTGRVLPSTI